VGVGAALVAALLWQWRRAWLAEREADEERAAAAGAPFVSPHNHLAELRPLRNLYVAVRHGESEANALGIISSKPEVALTNHGLTELGRQQGEWWGRVLCLSLLAPHTARTRTRAAAQAAARISEVVGSRDVLIVHSDLKRAAETAAVLRSKLRLRDSAVVASAALRERAFGELDGQSVARYEDVWAEDRKSAAHTRFGAESVNSVLARTTRLVSELEQRHANTAILLVAHGDVLQILQTGFALMNPRFHRSLPHLVQCEVRPLKLAAADAASPLP
jgi:probable phosphoglycerate mutase